MKEPTDREILLDPELWPCDWALALQGRQERKYACVTPNNLLRVIHTSIFDFDPDAPATVYANVDVLLGEWMVD